MANCVGSGVDRGRGMVCRAVGDEQQVMARKGKLAITSFMGKKVVV